MIHVLVSMTAFLPFYLFLVLNLEEIFMISIGMNSHQNLFISFCKIKAKIWKLQFQYS